MRSPAFEFRWQPTAAAIALALLLTAPAAGLPQDDAGDTAFSRTLPGLTEPQLRQFADGRIEFRQRWVAPFNIGGNWGRGPTFNAEMCADCHPGKPGSRRSRATRLAQSAPAVAGEDEHGGPLPSGYVSSCRSTAAG
jgi:CxxC motif-containing protein (DUF1111 family)